MSHDLQNKKLYVFADAAEEHDGCGYIFVVEDGNPDGPCIAELVPTGEHGYFEVVWANEDTA